MSRALDDLAAGRAWKARDRLQGVLAHRQDDEVLELLAQVHHELGELPSAGALWFVLGRNDEAAREAMAAWRERQASPQARWFSVPPTVRKARRSEARIEALKQDFTRYERTESARRRAELGARDPWWEPVLFGGAFLVAAIFLVVMLGVGVVTTWRWVWGLSLTQ